MPLSDYTYIVTLGQSCATNFQLARAAMPQGVPASRCDGPFDWLFLSVKQIIPIIEQDFRGFFEHRSIVIDDSQDQNDCWRIRDGHGVISSHQMLRDGAERVPTEEAWFEFGKWLGGRVRSWQHHSQDARGNLLFIRNEDPAAPDDPEDLLRLVKLLSSKVAGRFLVAWVRFTPPLSDFKHPNIKMFEVRQTWPGELKGDQVNWMHDYGMGVAWRGHDKDWDFVWQVV